MIVSSFCINVNVIGVKEQDNEKRVLRIEEELEEFEERSHLLKNRESEVRDRLISIESRLKEDSEAYAEAESRRAEMNARMVQTDKQWAVYQEDLRRIEHEVNQSSYSCCPVSGWSPSCQG